jgi:hypothetical protein
MYYHVPSYIAGISQAVMEYSNVRSHHFVAIFLIMFLVGCSHPLEIQGQGDIISLSGERNCSKAEQPCANIVVFGYNETYTAIPKADNKFVGWEGCGDQYPTCSFNVAATYVRAQWFKTMPSLKAVFEATPPPSAPTNVILASGLKQIDIGWSAVAGANSYNLYFATESFGSPVDIANYANGIEITDITGTSYSLSSLTKGTTYYLVVVAVGSSGESSPSAEASGLPATGGLNDTGITFGGNYPDGNNAACSGENIAAQDCSHGRDAALNDDSDGDAGFSFTKLDANGDGLPASVLAWSCVQDNVTGLIWEVKATDGGLHDKDDRYNWYNTNSSTNGGANGFADDDGNLCEGYSVTDGTTYCNTQAYTARVNAAGLCGANNWRMPTIKELAGITNKGRSTPAIDTTYFPNTASNRYWSSSPLAGLYAGAWAVSFNDGADSGYIHDSYNRVRLVRDRQ